MFFEALAATGCAIPFPFRAVFHVTVLQDRPARSFNEARLAPNNARLAPNDDAGQRACNLEVAIRPLKRVT